MLLVGGYWDVMIGAQFFVHRQLETLRPEMLRVARHDAEIMAAHWDPDAVITFLDPESLKVWPEAGRKNFMDLLRPLGSYPGSHEEESALYVNATEVNGPFFIRGTCRETVRCTEGRTTLSFTLARPLSGPWRVVDIAG